MGVIGLWIHFAVSEGTAKFQREGCVTKGTPNIASVFTDRYTAVNL
jgi:hypothetical protein